ncbi:hypothetical protein BDZ85DRAFT_246982 [Elsinoe ampelina]|uniref:Uncharacterized protein n=1 Tax=Elsinoe ampelina TaxID=302913 RepID=A0A6A6GLJ7_9PEZI|nr:hypothetical protein BDZ85DRAFT_246982 [Elsinoe ampelina]
MPYASATVSDSLKQDLVFVDDRVQQVRKRMGPHSWKVWYSSHPTTTALAGEGNADQVGYYSSLKQGRTGQALTRVVAEVSKTTGRHVEGQKEVQNAVLRLTVESSSQGDGESRNNGEATGGFFPRLKIDVWSPAQIALKRAEREVVNLLVLWRRAAGAVLQSANSRRNRKCLSNAQATSGHRQERSMSMGHGTASGG